MIYLFYFHSLLFNVDLSLTLNLWVQLVSVQTAWSYILTVVHSTYITINYSSLPVASGQWPVVSGQWSV